MPLWSYVKSFFQTPSSIEYEIDDEDGTKYPCIQSPSEERKSGGPIDRVRGKRTGSTNPDGEMPSTSLGHLTKWLKDHGPIPINNEINVGKGGRYPRGKLASDQYTSGNFRDGPRKKKEVERARP